MSVAATIVEGTRGRQRCGSTAPHRLRARGAARTGGCRKEKTTHKRKERLMQPLFSKGAPRKCRQAVILNRRFKVVAFRAHQAIPYWTRTTALLEAATWHPTLVHRICSLTNTAGGNSDHACGRAASLRPRRKARTDLLARTWPRRLSPPYFAFYA